MNDIESTIDYIKTNHEKLNIGIDYSNGKDHTAITLLDKQAELVIKALQEKAEREKGCECCNPNLRKNGTGGMNNYIEGSRLIMKITKSEYRQITSGFNDYYVKETHEKHQIWVEHCPHCGRKLGGNDEHVHN